jgi:hypothetical protein
VDPILLSRGGNGSHAQESRDDRAARHGLTRPAGRCR